MTTCKLCGANVLWVFRQQNRGAMQVDVVPVANGNVKIVGSHATILAPAARRLAKKSGTPLHLNHFKTCPEQVRRRAVAL